MMQRRLDCDRFKEFSDYNQELFINEVKDADIIWIIAPWSWKNVPKIFENKKVLCTVHHVDFDKFIGKEKETVN